MCKCSFSGGCIERERSASVRVLFLNIPENGEIDIKRISGVPRPLRSPQDVECSASLQDNAATVGAPESPTLQSPPDGECSTSLQNNAATVDAAESSTPKSIPPQEPRSMLVQSNFSDGSMVACFDYLCGGSGRCRRASSSRKKGCDRATTAELERAREPI